MQIPTLWSRMPTAWPQMPALRPQMPALQPQMPALRPQVPTNDGDCPHQRPECMRPECTITRWPACRAQPFPAAATAAFSSSGPPSAPSPMHRRRSGCRPPHLAARGACVSTAASQLFSAEQPVDCGRVRDGGPNHLMGLVKSFAKKRGFTLSYEFRSSISQFNFAVHGTTRHTRQSDGKTSARRI